MWRKQQHCREGKEKFLPVKGFAEACFPLGMWERNPRHAAHCGQQDKQSPREWSRSAAAITSIRARMLHRSSLPAAFHRSHSAPREVMGRCHPLLFSCGGWEHTHTPPQDSGAVCPCAAQEKLSNPGLFLCLPLSHPS